MKNNVFMKVPIVILVGFLSMSCTNNWPKALIETKDNKDYFVFNIKDSLDTKTITSNYQAVFYDYFKGDLVFVFTKAEKDELELEARGLFYLLDSRNRVFLLDQDYVATFNDKSSLRYTPTDIAKKGIRLPIEKIPQPQKLTAVCFASIDIDAAGKPQDEVYINNIPITAVEITHNVVSLTLDLNRKTRAPLKHNLDKLTGQNISNLSDYLILLNH